MSLYQTSTNHNSHINYKKGSLNTYDCKSSTFSNFFSPQKKTESPIKVKNNFYKSYDKRSNIIDKISEEQLQQEVRLCLLILD